MQGKRNSLSMISMGLTELGTSTVLLTTIVYIVLGRPATLHYASGATYFRSWLSSPQLTFFCERRTNQHVSSHCPCSTYSGLLNLG